MPSSKISRSGRKVTRRARAALVGAGGRQRAERLAARVVLLVDLAVAPAHGDVQALRERVDHADADAVQAAGDLVHVAAELAAGVQLRQHDLDARQPRLGDQVDRDAAAVVRARHRSIGMQRHDHVVATPGERLVDGVVEHLVDEVMQAARTRGADVHAGSTADRLESLEDRDARCAVLRTRQTDPSSRWNSLPERVAETAPCHAAPRRTVMRNQAGPGERAMTRSRGGAQALVGDGRGEPAAAAWACGVGLVRRRGAASDGAAHRADLEAERPRRVAGPSAAASLPTRSSRHQRQRLRPARVAGSGRRGRRPRVRRGRAGVARDLRPDGVGPGPQHGDERAARPLVRQRALEELADRVARDDPTGRGVSRLARARRARRAAPGRRRARPRRPSR